MKTLLIIDPQIDFISGSLAVEGAVEAMDKLIIWLENHQEEYDNIVLTMDFHPHDHCSFTPQGGPWPKHCVQYSVGSSFYPPLLEAIHRQAELGKPFIVVRKGERQAEEEYSAFKYAIPQVLLDAEYIYMAGIAGDYCVKESYEDLIRTIPAHRIEKLEEYIPYINKEKSEKQ